MTRQALAAIFVLAVWWLGTGLVLRTVWLPRRTFRRSLAVVSTLAVAGVAGVAWSSRVASPGAAYVAFASAMAIWAWHETVFLLGAVTGPRRAPCPPGAVGWARFQYATLVVLHHEVALAATVLVLLLLTWGAPNQVGVATFLVLWVMRLSAKINVFLGVRNLAEGFVPSHLRYILSYFRRAPMNPFMPVSLAAGAAVTMALARGAVAELGSPFDLVAGTLVATLLAIAVLEHVLLMLPVPETLLWKWATRRRAIDALDALDL
jgi:putative photosynthetic complex assembly protein 2